MAAHSNRGTDAKRYGEYVRDSTISRDRSRKKEVLNDAIEEANKEIARADHAEAGRILNETVLPTLQNLRFTKPLRLYADDVDESDNWYWFELRRFMRTPQQYIDDAATQEASAGSELAQQLQGTAPAGQKAKRTIERALESAETVAAKAEVTAEQLTNKVDVLGFSSKLGEHLQDYEMDIGDPVKGVSTEEGALKTLHTGATGSGKSTGVEREAEDFYQANFDDSAKDFKVMDLVGLRDGENWFYDIPQQQPTLRRIREEQGVAADFVDADTYERPDLEIRVPMTPGISKEPLPYDVAGEEFVVKPFVVPASEIRKTLMVAFISSRLSEGQEETIRSAYEAVDREQDDWSLKDLADEIRKRDELPPKNKSTAINVIHSLQDRGFIRTKEHPRCIDWRDIFEDTETITVFSQAKTNTKVGQYTTFAYLVQTILDKREQMHDIPQLVLLMRELWKVAPHKRRQSSFEELAALQESIAQMLSGLFRENRHSGVHVIADTQDASDLHKAVRTMFNRYVVYNASYDVLDDIFKWTYNSRSKSFWKTLSGKAGEAGIVGQVQPAVDNRDIEFLSPVRYIPPSHHHRVSPGDDVSIMPDLNGWRARQRYFSPTTECPECDSTDLERRNDGYDVHCNDCGTVTRDDSGGREETLQRPIDVDGVEWDDETPTELQVDAMQQSDGPVNPADAPVEAFAEDCVYHTGDLGDYVIKTDIYAAFNEWRQKHGLDEWDFGTKSRQVTFGNRFKEAFEDEIKSAQRENKQPAYLKVTLTNLGQTYYEKSTVEAESAAAPIQGDD